MVIVLHPDQQQLLRPGAFSRAAGTAIGTDMIDIEARLQGDLVVALIQPARKQPGGRFPSRPTILASVSCMFG